MTCTFYWLPFSHQFRYFQGMQILKSHHDWKPWCSHTSSPHRNALSCCTTTNGHLHRWRGASASPDWCFVAIGEIQDGGVHPSISGIPPCVVRHWVQLTAAEARLISDGHVFIWVKPNSVPNPINLDGRFINMIRPLSTAAVCLAALLCPTAADTASDLTAALASDPSLSFMQQLVVQHPTLINDLVKDNTAVTIFVPNNDALQAHTATAGRPLTDTPAALLASILAYHVVAAGLVSASFNSAKGITAPTLLTGEVYNNRTATPELVAAYGTSADGQVVYAEKDDGGYTLQGGQAERINLTVVDRQWRRGYIQIVDR